MTGRFVPGEALTGEETVILNGGRGTVELVVGNTGDRPVQVGSHYFFEANASNGAAHDELVAVARRMAE